MTFSRQMHWVWTIWEENIYQNRGTERDVFGGFLSYSDNLRAKMGVYLGGTPCKTSMDGSITGRRQLT